MDPCPSPILNLTLTHALTTPVRHAGMDFNPKLLELTPRHVSHGNVHEPGYVSMATPSLFKIRLVIKILLVLKLHAEHGHLRFDWLNFAPVGNYLLSITLQHKRMVLLVCR
jgi:hypothetical protein